MRADDPARAAAPALLRDPVFIVALVIAVIVALGFGLVVPILPLYAADFGVGAFAVTIVVSAFAGVRLASNLYAGSLSDRIGSRGAVGWGAIIVGASSLATAAAPGYWWLVAFRGLGGFGSALFFTALLALVVTVVAPTHRGRAVGLLQGAFLFGLTVGPFVGGLLSEPLGLRWPFVIYAITCTAAGAVALRFLPRVEARGPSSASSRQGVVATWLTARRLCRDPAFLAALVMMAATRWSATGVRFSLLPLYASEIVGLGNAAVGFALGLTAVAQMLVLWPVGKASDTLGRRAVSVPAYLAFAAAAAAIGFASTPVAFLAAVAAYGIGTGGASVTPSAVVADVVPPGETGTGMGILNTAGDLGSVLGPLVSGLLVDLAGYEWGFGVAAAFLLVGAGFALRMRETLPDVATLRRDAR